MNILVVFIETSFRPSLAAATFKQQKASYTLSIKTAKAAGSNSTSFPHQGTVPVPLYGPTSSEKLYQRWRETVIKLLGVIEELLLDAGN